MNSVLLASSNDKGTDMLVQLIKAENSTQVSIVENGGEARRILLSNDYDLVIINSPLSDEFGHDLSTLVTEKSNAGVILIVKSEIADGVAAKVENYGVLVVAKPISRPIFYQAIKLIYASRKRILGLQSENVKLHNKIEEIRMVDRAKCALIQYLNYTEQQAHRHIEKQAMDMRMTRKEVAESIIKIYET